MLFRQALHHLSHFASPFLCVGYFQDRVLWTISMACPTNHNPPVLTIQSSWMSLWCPAVLFCFYIFLRPYEKITFTYSVIWAFIFRDNFLWGKFLLFYFNYHYSSLQFFHFFFSYLSGFSSQKCLHFITSSCLAEYSLTTVFIHVRLLIFQWFGSPFCLLTPFTACSKWNPFF
jgi:hypothetical protein